MGSYRPNLANIAPRLAESPALTAVASNWRMLLDLAEWALHAPSAIDIGQALPAGMIQHHQPPWMSGQTSTDVHSSSGHTGPGQNLRPRARLES